ncbi:hypothetical protein PBI_QYRZULA_75 [Mycobacterium phage Qyrzula]|uniref:Uncharacterized protein n=1 Tax=Mycobacterium phage Qyrzula TaxID=373414 RepID=Q19Z11_9CAUD|nr:gp75 [Mycobacterium phage Qyrzula]ABE67485.1 hypothetical protein PBI_QYRZULA_75 [Mycobacterium phage Qyrzula]
MPGHRTVARHHLPHDNHNHRRTMYTDETPEDVQFDQDREQVKLMASEAVTTAAPRRPMDLMAAAEEAERHARELRRQAALLAQAQLEASRPRMPELGGEGDHAVVSFTKYQSGREYRYAAIGWRVGRSVRWAVTGETTSRYNWNGLLEFIGEANWPSLYLMVVDKLLGPTPGNEPPVSEKMGPFGRVESTRRATWFGV